MRPPSEGDWSPIIWLACLVLLLALVLIWLAGGAL